MKKNFRVDDDFTNSRLDRWFRKKIGKIPQSLIEKNLRKGNIKVNRKKVKSSYKLQSKDEINIINFNFSINKVQNKLDKYIATKKEISTSSKLFIENNDNFSIINKPAGIAVQSGTKSKRNILDILSKTEEFKSTKPYSVHRIDKETTGLLIVAKNIKFAQLFTSLFRLRKIHKTYLTIAVGQLNNSKGTFNDTLYTYERNKKTQTNAITNYTVLDSNNNYMLLKLNPITGRKHQLRKQLLNIGNPIIGDDKYFLNNRKRFKNINLKLHAYKIKFMINNVQYNFKAKYNDNFEDFLKKNF